MKRVLFVDDEQRVLDGLKRMLYPLRNEWRMSFASSGREALELLDQAEYDVLVTDLRMPEMSGMELLANVVKLHPQVVRMVLSGTADQEVVLRSATLAHQYLVKPCDAATLRATVARAFSLRVILDDAALKKLISSMGNLPSVPSVYLRLMEVLRSLDVSPKEIAQVIGEDISMTTKVLQMVNSALFGIQRQITDPTQAVIYLGPELVRQLVLVASAFSAFQPKSRYFSIERLQRHSLAVGGLARNIAVAGPLRGGGGLRICGWIAARCRQAAAGVQLPRKVRRSDPSRPQRGHTGSHGGSAGVWDHPRGSRRIPVVAMGTSRSHHGGGTAAP